MHAIELEALPRPALDTHALEADLCGLWKASVHGEPLVPAAHAFVCKLGTLPGLHRLRRVELQDMDVSTVAGVLRFAVPSRNALLLVTVPVDQLEPFEVKIAPLSDPSVYAGLKVSTTGSFLSASYSVGSTFLHIDRVGKIFNSQGVPPAWNSLRIGIRDILTLVLES